VSPKAAEIAVLKDAKAKKIFLTERHSKAAVASRRE
jgi:hypothetical protein